MAGMLNLTDADESGFDALPAGSYQCEVFSHEMTATKGGENSALPAGTPMLKIQFKVLANRDGETELTDEDGKTTSLENRRFFGQWVIPPAEIDGQPYKHFRMMNGNLVSLFKALGYEQEAIQSKKGFDPDLDEKIGTPVLVTVGRDTEYNSNPVKRVKPLEEVATGGLL